jgi:hypothetical protein
MAAASTRQPVFLFFLQEQLPDRNWWNLNVLEERHSDSVAQVSGIGEHARDLFAYRDRLPIVMTGPKNSRCPNERSGKFFVAADRHRPQSVLLFSKTAERGVRQPRNRSSNVGAKK